MWSTQWTGLTTYIHTCTCTCTNPSMRQLYASKPLMLLCRNAIEAVVFMLWCAVLMYILSTCTCMLFFAFVHYNVVCMLLFMYVHVQCMYNQCDIHVLHVRVFHVHLLTFFQYWIVIHLCIIISCHKLHWMMLKYIYMYVYNVHVYTCTWTCVGQYMCVYIHV